MSPRGLDYSGSPGEQVPSMGTGKSRVLKSGSWEQAKEGAKVDAEWENGVLAVAQMTTQPRVGSPSRSSNDRPAIHFRAELPESPPRATLLKPRHPPQPPNRVRLLPAPASILPIVDHPSLVPHTSRASLQGSLCQSSPHRVSNACLQLAPPPQRGLPLQHQVVQAQAPNSARFVRSRRRVVWIGSSKLAFGGRSKWERIDCTPSRWSPALIAARSWAYLCT